MAGWHRGRPGTAVAAAGPRTGSGSESRWRPAPAAGAARHPHRVHPGAAGNLWSGQPAAAGFPVVPGSRLNPACWEQGPARPVRPAEEEWAHADSSPRRPPPPSHRRASSSRRDNTGREDQNKLRRPRLCGLGSAAMPIAARSAILVRPAYLPAVDPPPVTSSPSPRRNRRRSPPRRSDAMIVNTGAGCIRETLRGGEACLWRSPRRGGRRLR